MTHEDRVVAAARAFPRAISREEIEAILAVAYPELTAGTHWLAPREMTPEMVKAAEDRDDWFPDGMGNASAESHWSAARDAYLREGGK